jgi:hypothetical protein
MAAGKTFCDREKRDLDTARYVGIVRSPNAWGGYAGSVVPLLHTNTQLWSASER